MTRFGYTLMTEQSGPQALVGYARAAEDLGFDFEVMSDHFSPWLDEMGHSPNAWATLGAVSQVTERVELMTYVTCPTMRYHPAVVAQQAATVGLLSDGRFTLGLGAGENLNEHVIGAGWPPVAVRHDRLAEAAEIIRLLLTGEQITWSGEHFRVDSARVWDVADRPPEIGIAVSGPASVERFAPLADHLIAVQPERELVEQWDAQHPTPSRKVGQIPICWGRDRDAAVAQAHRSFRWFAGGWDVNADLPTPRAFAAATTKVRPEDVAADIPCGPDLDAIVAAVAPWWEAGFTDVALVQIGDEDQQAFLDEAAGPLLELLRTAAKAAG